MSKGKALLSGIFLLISGVFISGSSLSAYCERCERDYYYSYPYGDDYYRDYGDRPLPRDGYHYQDYHRDYYYPNYRVERHDNRDMRDHREHRDNRGIRDQRDMQHDMQDMRNRGMEHKKPHAERTPGDKLPSAAPAAPSSH